MKRTGEGFDRVDGSVRSIARVSSRLLTARDITTTFPTWWNEENNSPRRGTFFSAAGSSEHKVHCFSVRYLSYPRRVLRKGIGGRVCQVNDRSSGLARFLEPRDLPGCSLAAGRPRELALNRFAWIVRMASISAAADDSGAVCAETRNTISSSAEARLNVWWTTSCPVHQ